MRVQGQAIPDHVLNFPLTCRFDIEKKNFANANTAHFRLYGLSLSSRKDIYYDPESSTKLLSLVFKAGYTSQANFPVIFAGTITDAYTDREGPELVTVISANDGGASIFNSTISLTVDPPWGFTSTIKKVMGRLQGVDVGQVLVGPKSNPAQEPPAGTKRAVFNGKVWDVLQAYTPRGGSLSINNGTVNMLGRNITLPSPGITEVSSATGLLNIPRKHGAVVDVQCLFEPNFRTEQFVNLISELAPWVNGKYKIVGMHHYGTISGVESGDARTDLQLLSTASI